MAGKFTFFWSVLVPLIMLIGSVATTYALYRHFASKTHEKHKET